MARERGTFDIRMKNQCAELGKVGKRSVSMSARRFVEENGVSALKTGIESKS